MQVLRVDILHDVGSSLNPALDIGQVEGGFVQGMGWLTTEELVFDGKGRLTTHAPATYKIPVASDVPAIFNTRLHMRPNPTAKHLSLEGGRRAAADARHFRLFARSSTRCMPRTPRDSRGSRPRARRSRSSTLSTR